MLLPEGIVSIDEYKELLQTPFFEDIERFSDQFLIRNRDHLSGYRGKWVMDPLHQWSRQWEYPFVYSRLRGMHGEDAKIKILDAGSGVTFFPYFIKSRIHSADVYSCDNDISFGRIINAINQSQNLEITHSFADLAYLPYHSNFFDYVYCVSVLEHIKDYSGILQELFRVMKPGGMINITFDISMDGTRDISIEDGNILLSVLEDMFIVDNDLSLDLSDQMSRPDLFTTEEARKINQSLLPWKYPGFVYQVKNLIQSQKFTPWPPKLTCFCISLQKPS